MTTRLYVGNIPYDTTRKQLEDFFAPHTLTDVKIVLDRDSGRPRGFAFVEIDNSIAAASAIESLDGHELGGRRIVVNLAKEKEHRSGGGRGSRERRHDERRQKRGNGRAPRAVDRDW